MSQYNGGGITVKTPLQIVTSAYEQSQADRYVAKRIFPNVTVKKRTGDFWKLNPADWLRNQVQKRAAGTIARRGGWRYQEGPLYRVLEYTARIAGSSWTTVSPIPSPPTVGGRSNSSI